MVSNHFQDHSEMPVQDEAFASLRFEQKPIRQGAVQKVQYSYRRDNEQIQGEPQRAENQCISLRLSALILF